MLEGKINVGDKLTWNTITQEPIEVVASDCPPEFDYEKMYLTHGEEGEMWHDEQTMRRICIRG